MIEQALKVIASFKDEASAGIKKLQDQLNGISRTNTNLGGLTDPRTTASVDRAAEAVKRVNEEAKKTASGGLAQLAGAFGAIKANFGGLLDGSSSVSDALAGALAGAAETGAAAFAALGAGAAVAGAKVATTAQQTRRSAEEIKQALEVFQRASTARLDVGPNRPNDPVNAGSRAVRAFGRDQLGLERAAYEALVSQTRSYNNALENTNGLLKSVRENLRVAFRDSNYAQFVREITSDKITTAASRFAPLGAAIVGIGGAALAAAGTLGTLSIALNAAADDSAELAEKLGISVDRLKALQLIANETGTSVQELSRIYDKLSKDVLGKTNVGQEQIDALTNLGLALDDVKNLSQEALAIEILDRYEALGGSAEAAAAAQVLLGEGFRNSSLGIRAASTSFNEFADRVKQYGAGESKILIEQGAQQEVAFNNLSLALAGFGTQIAESVGPAITIIVQGFADLVNSLRRTEIAGKVVQGVFGAIKLVLIDSTRFVAGLAAALVAFLGGDFRLAGNIAKAAFEDAGNAVRNFGAKTKEAEESTKRLTEEEVKAAQAAQRRAAAQKKAAEEAKKAADELNKLFQNAENDLFRQLELLDATTEAERVQFEIENGRYKALSANQKALLIDLAQMIDLKRQELDATQRQKQLESDIAAEQTALSLAEEELNFAFLTADEREKQIFLLRELNKLRLEGKDIDEVTLNNMREQIKVLADRRAALRKAQDEQATQSAIIAESEAAITASVQRNIQLAAELLTARKINEADYVRYVEAQVKRVTDLNRQAADETAEFWRAAAQGIQGAFQSFFFDFMQGNLTDLVGGVKRAIDQVVANILAARAAAALFGAEFGRTGQVGGFVGAAGQFLGSFFGGARAEGGPIEAGKAYLVGERGPELRTFGAPGNIVSNDKLRSLGSNVNISFRVDAIDAASFRSKIDEFKRDIASAVSDAQVSYGV